MIIFARQTYIFIGFFSLGRSVQPTIFQLDLNKTGFCLCIYLIGAFIEVDAQFKYVHRNKTAIYIRTCNIYMGLQASLLSFGIL